VINRVRVRKSRKLTNSRSERTLESQESVLNDSEVGVAEINLKLWVGLVKKKVI